MANAIMLALSTALAPRQVKGLQPVDNRGGWWPIVREAWAGAWQQNVTVTLEDSLRYWAVFRAIAIISSDIAKMRLKLVEQGADGLWTEISDAALSPVIRKPNAWQTRIQFWSNWMESKLSRGNTYALKHRDARGAVTGLTVLDPNRVTPMVAQGTGEVFYRLLRDDLAELPIDVTVPASEIIHDRWNTLYHPLVGLSPLYAAGVNALTALKIETASARLFANGARPSGVLTAPGAISEATALRVKTYWDENFTGENAGKVAVLGDDLKYAQMQMSAVDAQVIDQLKWNDTAIFGVYGIPAFLGNVGTAPSYNNVEALELSYYTRALQIHIESIEVLLDEGLGLTEIPGKTYGTEFDIDDLVRMDTAAKVKTAVEGLKGLWSTNEARRKFDMKGVPGGDAVMSQQQNFSLEALAKRDAKDDPFANAKPPPEPKPDNDEEEPDEDDDDTADRGITSALTEQILEKARAHEQAAPVA